MSSQLQEQVRTTTAIVPPYSEHPTIYTSNPRVILRPFHLKDLKALHELRSQIEVMQWTSTGKVDVDLEFTLAWMKRFMQKEVEQVDGMQRGPEGIGTDVQSFNFVVVYRSDTDPAPGSDEVIGAMGVHRLQPEAEVGYMIRKEFWGKGIMSVAMQDFIKAWWSLPRKIHYVAASQADEVTASGAPIIHDENVVVWDEVLKAEIAETNIASRRILEKCGFQYHGQESIVEHGKEVELVRYVLRRPSAAEGNDTRQ